MNRKTECSGSDRIKDFLVPPSSRLFQKPKTPLTGARVLHYLVVSMDCCQTTRLSLFFSCWNKAAPLSHPLSGFICIFLSSWSKYVLADNLVAVGSSFCSKRLVTVTKKQTKSLHNFIWSLKPKINQQRLLKQQSKGPSSKGRRKK